MKSLLILMAMLFVASSAFSATTKTTSNNQSLFNFKNFSATKVIRSLNDGWRAGIALGSLESNQRARKAGADLSNKETRNSEFQAQVGWEKVKNKEIGYSSFFTYQNINDIFSGDNGKDEYDARNMRVSANATWGFSSKVYTYGGLNYGKFFANDEVENNLNAGFGYQAGIGAKLGKRAQLEFEYLNLSNKGRTQGVNINTEVKGLMIKINTPFSINI